MKSSRQQKILELIEEYEIETQEELMFYLDKYGYEVTQATISRDIRELKLIKVSSSVGNYKYATQTETPVAVSLPRLNGAIADSIIKVSYANNIIVLKTFPGLANAIGSGIDSLREKSILGCVAGDDTVIVVLSDNEKARETADKIKHMMRSV